MEIIGNMSTIEHELACFLDDSYGWGDYFFLNERQGTLSILLAQSRIPSINKRNHTGWHEFWKYPYAFQYGTQFFAIKRNLMKHIIDTYVDWQCKRAIDIYLFELHQFYQTQQKGHTRSELFPSMRKSSKLRPPCVDRVVVYPE
jgi:hypothetical protein